MRIYKNTPKRRLKYKRDIELTNRHRWASQKLTSTRATLNTTVTSSKVTIITIQ